MNSSSLIALSQLDSATIVNIQQSKTVSHFYAMPNPIMNMFSYPIANLLITDSTDGILNTWDTSVLSKVPVESYFIYSDSKLISSDYNSDSSFYYALDGKGNAYIKSVKKYSDEVVEGNLIKEDKNRPLMIKGDRTNLNQYVVGYEHGIKFFDLRTFKCVKELKRGKNVMNILNDSKEVLIIENNNIELCDIETTEKEPEGGLLQTWTQFNNITHSNFGVFYQNNIKKSMIILGMNNGDVYYSSLSN